MSPPVRMHGGLICIAFCMYVCLSVTRHKFIYHQTVAPRVMKFDLSSIMSLMVSSKGRWAHFNVKLHFFLHNHVWEKKVYL